MKSDPAPRILVHGHRGARAVYPENTIPAFEYAIQVGAEFIELDLAVTKDNVLVVSHDPHINPEICAGRHAGVAIRELTLAELHESDCGALKNPRFPNQQPLPETRIPTFDEVLALSSGNKIQFNIEIKSFPMSPELTPPPDLYAGMVFNAIRNHKLESRAVVQSFDFRILHAMTQVAPHIPLAALWEGAPRSFVEIAREGEAGTIAPFFKLVTAEQVNRAHDANIKVVPWTANGSAEWQMLIDAGVDAIITDDPAALIEYLKQRALR